ncbi:hypothetical protein B0H13DRAFT_2246621 [Mycena leptocephala]|nr:hypothetical protein B0H13DRAFT_2246621 [Mycena leptocephala]
MMTRCPPKFPSALQLLDLPPDDAQVLRVFKSAASGWQSSTNRPEEIGGEADAEEAYVSHQLVEGDSDADEDEDEYHQDAEPDADSDSDSDEYMEGPSTRRCTRTPAKRRARPSSRSSVSSVGPPDPKKRRKLTARQTEACLATYALFFPSASEEELPNQRIGIKDVQRLSKLIGDKLKGEMLSEFSTSPDKSMSFADFGDMMRAVKLV